VANAGVVALSGFGATGLPCPLCGLGTWGSGTNVGWVIGAGAERAVGGNWSWKAEYLFVDLGNVDTVLVTPPGNYGNAGFSNTLNSGTGTISSRITESIFRVGLNYQFH
jgi:outer membrane immunogenic protein